MTEKKKLTREEEADEIVKRLATHPMPQIDDYFEKIILPMIRKIKPTLIANEIVGVQPMTTYKKDKE